ncbi:MAG: Na(+)-translocating NADH-quinone reductase subunit A [Bacteroidaceae bacterium]|nr:Na(+)-translocating NADH-quinone reductase subunit A [Bacteroidaceae bacterium]MBR3916761.1 Na(+)-translocating NADH-quinone reductase subunit A [Bacteroidaceae bacterium]
MHRVVKISKGLNINLKGAPVAEMTSVETAKQYALMPADFTRVTPKVVVKPEDTVKAGDPLFVDKSIPELQFVSPVSGKVVAVNRGERRRVLSVVVESDGKFESVEYKAKDVLSLSSDEIKADLLKAGLFAFMRQRPYDVIADPKDAPRAIYVSAFDSKPLAVSFEVALKGNEEDFQTGLDALSRIAPVHLGICACQKSTALLVAKNVVTTIFKGPHPAGNVGVQINKTAPVNKGEIVWTIGAEEVIFIGRLFNKGKVDFTRTVALAGSEVKNPSYSKVVLGAQLTNLLKGRLEEKHELRIIDGNVLTGKKTTADGFLGAFSTEVTVIPEIMGGDELLGWAMPRFSMYSTSHSYFSWLFPKRKYTIDARIKGGERHMIMSNEYDKVFPMDIYPEYLIKAIITGNIDKMEQLGIYEVAPEDFALCEFVDSSKLELQRIVREGLDKLRAEMC